MVTGVLGRKSSARDRILFALKNTALSRQQLLAATGLPERTLRHSLARLKAEGFVKEFVSLTDARKKVYAQVAESGKAPDCRSGDRGFKSRPAL